MNAAASVAVETIEAAEKEDGINIPLIAGIGAGAAALIGGAVALICRRKTKKSGK